MIHTLTMLLAVGRPALTVARGVPQVVRLLGSEPDGVSVLTWQLWLILGEPWIAYGIVQHVPAEVVTNCCTTVLALLTLLLVTRSTGGTRRMLSVALASSAAVVLFIIVCVHAHDTAVISVVAVSGSVTMYLPQAVRTFRSGSLSGVSLGTWSLALVTAIAWGVYGLLIDKVPVWLPSIVMVPASAVIVAKLWARRALSLSSLPGLP